MTEKIPENKVVVIDGKKYNIYIGDLYDYGWKNSQLSYKLYKEIMSYDLDIHLQQHQNPGQRIANYHDGKDNWNNADSDGEVKEIKDWLKRKFNPKEIDLDDDGANYNTIWFSLNDKVLEFFGIKIPSKPPSKKDCSEGCTWSNAYIRNDYGLEDDGTASVEYGQRCEVCDVERRGSIGGEVSWDMNAEEKISKICPNCEQYGRSKKDATTDYICDFCAQCKRCCETSYGCYDYASCNDCDGSFIGKDIDGCCGSCDNCCECGDY